MLDFVAQPLVEPTWLAAHLHDEEVRVIDARWRGDGPGRELYRQGHLPGAVHLDWQRDLSWTDGRGVGYLLLPPERFAAVMEAAGSVTRRAWSPMPKRTTPGRPGSGGRCATTDTTR